MQYIRKSNKFSLTFEITNCDGSQYDLSQSTLRFIVKKSKEDPDETAVLSSEVVNSDTNIITFQFDATQTNLDVGNYVGAIKEFKDNNLNSELWNDNIQVVKEVFND